MPQAHPRQKRSGVWLFHLGTLPKGGSLGPTPREVSTADLCSVFDTIDFDGSGSIDMEEFLNGMVYLSADLRAIHVVQARARTPSTRGQKYSTGRQES